MSRTLLHVIKRTFVPFLLVILLIGAFHPSLNLSWNSTASAQEEFQPILPGSRLAGLKPLSSSGSAISTTPVSSSSGVKKKVVYLTFDDGPTKLTDQVLAILSKNKAKATFFVLGEQAERYPEVIRRISEGGHALGNHTYDHVYKKLYHNFSEFWRQIKQTEEILRNITGSRTPLVRAPGGTYGHFDSSYFSLLKRGGYAVFDWDVDTRDSSRKGVPSSEMIRNVKLAELKDQIVVLMHDGAGHEQTIKALPRIIEYYKSHGYEFQSLSSKVKPVQFSIKANGAWGSRIKPTKKWVEDHVVPNAALFQEGRQLVLSTGGVETEMGYGEYELSEGRYKVPLRAAMERLGASVQWSSVNRAAVITWGKKTLTIKVDSNTAEQMTIGKQGSAGVPFALETRGDTVWVPLRSLLGLLGHPIVSVTKDRDYYRVKAL
ncbi:polysaccharide deacetylase [Paenibacillus sp. J22TS3]|uniref:polysaccharide deacetylase n=1 Tax=Paenibacillus sp. J22TS3 TaxID=2807192 RepID=UPI001B1E8ADB|nr:polysaccharide deacetylase [Paenibacillus sp. J22TS3]GIP23711.1 hypothetical protein J22TS3_39860 [Paenibacillus sp. J22TS3]